MDVSGFLPVFVRVFAHLEIWELLSVLPFLWEAALLIWAFLNGGYIRNLKLMQNYGSFNCRFEGVKVDPSQYKESIPAVVKFLGLMKTRMEVIVDNLANSDTTWDTKGKASPYRRKDFLIDKEGNASVVIDKTSPRRRYLPNHPHANESGYVFLPNINVLTESVKMLDAQREYYLAESLLERCLPDNYIPDYSIQMVRQSAEHLIEFKGNQYRLDRIERKLDALKPAE